MIQFFPDLFSQRARERVKLLELCLIFLIIATLIVPTSAMSGSNSSSYVSIVITSYPTTGIGYISVDGQGIITPATFSWKKGDSHVISATSEIELPLNQSRFLFSNWSDGGESLHTVIVPSYSMTYSANFKLQYPLTVIGANTISFVNNSQSAYWYDAGALTKLSIAWRDFEPEKSSTSLWLPFDEGSGDVVKDYSLNYFNNVMIDASWVEGRFGKALLFNGINNYLTVPIDISSDNTYSLSFWVLDNSTTYSYKRWITTTLGAFTNDSLCLRETDSGNIQLVAAGNSAFTDGIKWKGAWHQFTLTSGKENTKLFMDNNPIPILMVNATCRPEAGFLFIGGKYVDNNNEFAQAVFDDFRIYDYSLSTFQIVTNFNALEKSFSWYLDGDKQPSLEQRNEMLITSTINMSAAYQLTFEVKPFGEQTHSAEEVPCKLVVKDYLGFPLHNVSVELNFLNGTVLLRSTDINGTVSLGHVSNEYYATINYLGTITKTDIESANQQVVTVIIAGWPTLLFIVSLVSIILGIAVIIKKHFQISALDNLLSYFRVNWGAPFILSFFILLSSAAISLASDLNSIAVTLAIYAFYALAIGITLQLFCFLKYSKKDNEESK